MNADGGAFKVPYPSTAPISDACNDHWQSLQRMPNNPAGFVATMSQPDAHAGLIAAGSTPTGYMLDAVFTQVMGVGDTRYKHAGGSQMPGDYLVPVHG